MYIIYIEIQFIFGPFFSFRSCDPNLFSLYHSGVMLPKAKLTVDSYKAMLDVLMATKTKKTNQPTSKEGVLVDCCVNCL